MSSCAVTAQCRSKLLLIGRKYCNVLGQTQHRVTLQCRADKKKKLTFYINAPLCEAKTLLIAKDPREEIERNHFGHVFVQLIPVGKQGSVGYVNTPEQDIGGCAKSRRGKPILENTPTATHTRSTSESTNSRGEDRVRAMHPYVLTRDCIFFPHV